MSATGPFPPSVRRVALLTDRFTVGGGAAHIYQIARGMPDIEFGIFADGGRETQIFENLPNTRIFPEGYHPRDIRLFQPHLIHIHHLRPLLRLLMNPFRHWDIPVFFTVHGLHIHQYEFQKGYEASIKYFLRYRLEKYLYGKTDRLITVSHGDDRYLKVRYGNYPGACIPNAIDELQLPIPDSGKSALRSQLNLPADSWLYLTVARFPFQKGHDILLGAIAQVQEALRERNICFIFVGGGPGIDSVRELAARLEVGDLVRFTGSRPDVLHFMRACDVFLLPSRWEGLPITLLEAAACKLPMLVSNTFGNREIVDHLRTGLLFENEDTTALAAWLPFLPERSDLLKSLAEAALDRVRQEYALRDMIRRLRTLYFGEPSEQSASYSWVADARV